MGKAFRCSRGVREGGQGTEGAGFEKTGDVGRDVCLLSMRAYAAAQSIGSGGLLVKLLGEAARSSDRHESVMAVLGLACLCEENSVHYDIPLSSSLCFLTSGGARTRRYGALLARNVCRFAEGRNAMCVGHATQLASLLRATADSDPFAARYAAHAVIYLLSDRACARLLVDAAGGASLAQAQLSYAMKECGDASARDYAAQGLALLASLSQGVQRRAL